MSHQQPIEKAFVAVLVSKNSELGNHIIIPKSGKHSNSQYIIKKEILRYNLNVFNPDLSNGSSHLSEYIKN